METGDKYILEHAVTSQETADNIGSGGLPVFATPAMAALMEKAAYTLAHDGGLETVGTSLAVTHSRACLPGTKITVSAEIAGIEGRKIAFRLEVYDNDGLIGEGSHERFVIDPERFMSKLGKRQ